MNKTGNFLNESDRKILKYSHIDWPGTDTGSSRWETGGCLRHGKVQHEHEEKACITDCPEFYSKPQLQYAVAERELQVLDTVWPENERIIWR